MSLELGDEDADSLQEGQAGPEGRYGRLNAK
jgi:hypothetical protein